MKTLVVDSSLGLAAAPGLLVVARARGRSGWGSLDIDGALDRLAGAEEPIVLAADLGRDPGAGALLELASAAGAEPVLLPDDHFSRLFVVAVGRRWLGDGVPEAAASLGTLSSALAGRVEGQELSGLGSASVARWARRAGIRCDWCVVGRPVRRGRCARCGAAAP